MQVILQLHIESLAGVIIMKLIDLSVTDDSYICHHICLRGMCNGGGVYGLRFCCMTYT